MEGGLGIEISLLFVPGHYSYLIPRAACEDSDDEDEVIEVVVSSPQAQDEGKASSKVSTSASPSLPIYPLRS